MRTLALDLETYSSADLEKSGVYPYVEAPDFEILLCAYAFDAEPVRCIDIAQGERLPDDLLQALTDPCVLKTAYNAGFERTCLRRWLGRPMPPQQWSCTMALAATLGLPGALSGVADALRLSEDRRKMTAAGKALIKYFSMPCAPAIRNGGRTRNRPCHDADKWALFKMYNMRDVEVERAVRDALAAYPLLESERQTWALDQKINDLGVRIDLELVDAAIEIDLAQQKVLMDQMQSLTGLENPNSLPQLKKWLQGRDVDAPSLNKESVTELIVQCSDDAVRRVLALRQALSKTSTAKYAAMRRGVCADGRLRGLLKYYGASRTGRWAGRYVQPQNLPRNYIRDLDTARALVKGRKEEELELFYERTADVLSQLIRTAFIPAEGHRFICADFSAIEARVLAWLAGERWRLDVFKTHGKIYEASASQMFGVPLEEITKESALRQKGKVAELALGYNGGPKALISMGALEQGLQEEELPALVKAWRLANPHIAQYWQAVQQAAVDTVATGTPQALAHGVRFELRNQILFIRLPSGRRLAYLRPKIVPGRFGDDALAFMGVNQDTRAWGRQDTFGGRLVENITQATARDCLRDAMLALDGAGYKIVMHVHDEVIVEAPAGDGSLEDVCEIMGRPLVWARGLPLRADGSEMAYYQKE